EVKSFIKGDENIYRAESLVPDTLPWGILVLLLYIAGLFFWLYRRYLRLLFFVSPEQLADVREPEIAFKKGRLDVYTVDNEIYPNLLYTTFSGEGRRLGHTGKITLDDRDITATGPGESLLYLCRPQQLPQNTTPRNFINFITSMLKTPREEKEAITYEFLKPNDLDTKIKKLQNHQKGELLSIVLGLKKSSIYLLDDTCKKMAFEFVVRFKEQMEALAAQGSAVVLLTTDEELSIHRTVKHPLLFSKSKLWAQKVEHFKKERSTAAGKSTGENIKKKD
ncbi:MAG: hypothetical protein GY950_36850, partial [bacterium]|nr:hypothetical protein [bacterium]